MLAGRYRVLAPVGRGAIAEVVRARDERTGAEVALKILYPHLRESAAVVERFRREVEIVSKISHPNVLAIHDVVDSDGQLFLVMDYHPGGDLADRLAARRALAADEVRDLAAQLCGALAAAHRAGVVHRDVKPSNVLCGAGPRLQLQLDVRLCDFGLARTVELSGLTTANAVLGTPEYMAPEVVVDGHADPRSDIYSLGVMLFEAATGRLPFYGDSPYQLMRQHVDSEAPRARGLAPDLPPAIDAAIARALAKDPLDRFATAEDLARALADDASAPTSNALVPAAGAAAAAAPARRACPKCGGWMVAAAAACADCGAALLRIDHQENGASVLVVGPGQPGDKIDATKHVALYKLLDELPPGSIAIEKGGHRRAPRVPFIVARDVTEATAKRLIKRLEAAGFDAVMRSGSAFKMPGMRKKLWEMTKRQTAGASMLFYLAPNFLTRLLPHHFFMDLLAISPIVLSLWGFAFRRAVVRCRAPLIAPGPSGPRDGGVHGLADLLARLPGRQDRRLVGHILERIEKLAALGRGELTNALVNRATLAANGLAAVGQRRRFDVSVPDDRQAALEEMRREEKAAVVFRGELLRVASRLDDLCLLAARANAAAAPDEIARLDGEIQDLALAVDAEQEVVALLGEQR
jgi:tRNA A-37 threonylcarbamoyl transferase component Bud32